MFISDANIVATMFVVDKVLYELNLLKLKVFR